MKVLINSVCLLMLLVAGLVSGEEMADEKRAELRAKMEQRQAALNLSADQQEQIRPILKENFEKQREVFERYGFTRQAPGEERPKLGWRKARKLGQEMAVLRRDVRAQLKPILTEPQLEEWDKIQKERQAQGRALIQQRMNERRKKESSS